MEALDSNKVECLGSAPVKIKYQGRTARTQLLVIHKVKDEVILSRKVLEDLEIIDKDFPKART